MSYLFSDPKFWLLISFIVFVILMIKPFKSMMIGGLDSKIEEIKQNIDKSLESFKEAEEKLSKYRPRASSVRTNSAPNSRHEPRRKSKSVEKDQ